MKMLKYLSLAALVYIGACAPRQTIARDSLEGAVEDSVANASSERACEIMRETTPIIYWDSHECRIYSEN